MKIEPEITSKSVTFDFVENNLVIHIDKILFKDKATLYAEIENVIDHLIVYDGALTEGDNIIGNIDSTKDYIIRPYMVEKNGLFGTVRTFMRWVTVNGRFSIANIANYHVNIAAVFNKGEKLEINNYLYGIDRLDKSETDDGVFYGRFYAVPCNDGKPDFKNKKLIGKVCMNIDISSIENEQKSVCTMSMLETEYGEYAEPYYDIERKMIISPGNKRLLGKDYDKFLPLFEDETTFCLELKHRKEQKNVIQTN